MAQREEIIAMASQMFYENGIKSIRMDDIAVAMVMSKRTLYEMFSDKEALLYECLSYTVRMRQLKVREMVADLTGYEKLLEGARYTLQLAEEGVKMRREMERFYPKLFQKFAEEQAKIGMESLTCTLQRFMDDGLIEKNVNIGLSVLLLYHMSHGIFSRHVDFLPENVTPGCAFMYAMVNIIRGISTRAGIDEADKYIARHFDSEQSNF